MWHVINFIVRRSAQVRKFAAGFCRRNLMNFWIFGEFCALSWHHSYLMASKLLSCIMLQEVMVKCSSKITKNIGWWYLSTCNLFRLPTYFNPDLCDVRAYSHRASTLTLIDLIIFSAIHQAVPRQLERTSRNPFMEDI